jgi:hypothetical protein
MSTILKIGRRVQSAFQETEARIETLTPSIEARVTPAQIQETIMVKLHPETTDKPVLAELTKTNKLLEKLIAAQGGPRSAPVTATPRNRGADRDTSDVAAGRV